MANLTIWLLVLILSDGSLKVMDAKPSQKACIEVLAAAPNTKGAFCISASSPAAR